MKSGNLRGRQEVVEVLLKVAVRNGDLQGIEATANEGDEALDPDATRKRRDRISWIWRTWTS